MLNYCAADNNLYAYIYDDVASMEQIGSSNGIQLVAQFDHQNAGAYRFRVEQDKVGQGERQRIDSPVMESLGKVNMSDPKTLADFITWGMKTFPAERTMLLIADHGKGWEGLVQDDSHKGWMSVPQLRQALEEAYQSSGKKLDVIGFDACQMASVEVASELKDYAQYMVASQALEAREGWPYAHILGNALLQDLHRAQLFKSDIEPRQAVELVVQSAAENAATLPTMSALDLGQMAALESRLKAFSGQLKSAGLQPTKLREVRGNTQSFGFVYDLGHFLKETKTLAQAQGKSELVSTIDSCLEQLQRVVVAEHHSQEYPQASGLTVELKRANDRNYSALHYPQQTDWKQALETMARA